MEEDKLLQAPIIEAHYQQIRRYEELIERYKAGPQSLHFVSQYSQLTRFLQFLKIGLIENKKILDLGCGLGDFFKFLQEQGITTHYTGYDIVSHFVGHCLKTYPEAHFEERDILFSKPAAKFDYIFASGIFAHTNQPSFEEIVTLAFDMCEQGFAFNMFETTQPDFFHITQEEVLFFCNRLNPRKRVLVEEYLPGDYTIILYK
jgi:SAM-dependent methyltransferase